MQLEAKRKWGNSDRKPIRVEPIRSKRHRFLIREYLKDRPRDCLLFTLGINNGLRLKDILSLRVGQVRYLKPGEAVVIVESKTGKQNDLVMNSRIHRDLHAYLSTVDLLDDDFLFRSPKTGKALLSISAGRLVQDWCRAIGLKGNYGAHTLRKSWAYAQRTEFKTPWELVCKRLNHSSPAITQIYLGISREEIVELIANNEL